MKRPTRRVAPSTETVTRRTLLEWLGRATVLTLGADLVAACTAASQGGAPDLSLKDSTPPQTTDGSLDTSSQLNSDWLVSDGGFPFAPGQPGHSVYDGWGERTVDPQQLTQILANWSLTVDGLVEEPLTLSFVDLVDLPRQDQITDFHCVEGWSIFDVPWNGIHLSTLFEAVRPKPEATHVTFHTIGGSYNESLPLSVAKEPRTLLAYGIAGATLPLKHGFPLRLVVPRLLGYKNAKYVQRIELAAGPVNGYWVAAGYSYDAEVPQSRLRPGKY
jgi:DMSO/TMAO reductase YedYZ molybdopterin-dependent catalytic subunit